MATKKKVTTKKKVKPVVKKAAAKKPAPKPVVVAVAKRKPSVPADYSVCPFPDCGSTKIRIFQIKGGQAVKHQCCQCRRFLEGAA